MDLNTLSKEGLLSVAIAAGGMGSALVAQDKAWEGLAFYVLAALCVGVRSYYKEKDKKPKHKS